MSKCRMCPRQCNVDRKIQRGFCSGPYKTKIARVGLHKWEEPCISYGKGSGTIFFSGCVLRCVFCQNHEISAGLKGKEVDEKTLEREILKLRDSGAENINLVTPTQYALNIVPVLEKIKGKTDIPIIYNTGGYESTETLKKLHGLVDVYLPDIKYFDSKYSTRYSNCSDYFEKASLALECMHTQVGYAQFDNDGHIKKGVMVRHLCLPTLCEDSINILRYLAENYDVNKLPISLMCQYFPTHKATDFPEINRTITTLEYQKVVAFAREMGFTKGYVQQKSSAKQEYVPDFDYE